VFAAELDQLPGQRRRALVDALQGVTIWAFWESLRSDLGLSREQARATVAEAVLALFARTGVTSA